MPNVSLCVAENEVHYNPWVRDYSKEYLTFEVVESGTITVRATEASVVKTISFSTDKGNTWTELTTTTTAQELGESLSVGDKVLIKGTNTSYGTALYSNTFNGTAKVNVYGNIMSLINGDNFANTNTLTTTHTFTKLFYENTNLLSAENLILPTMTLTNDCYNNMFNGCTSLRTAPELPATTLAQECYYNMFHGCTSLTIAPALPAETMVKSCYQYMFNGCSSLRTAPELPATTLAQSCYNSLFYNCTSLETAPTLPATSLASGCYNFMFGGCTSLNYIKAMFTTTPSDNYTRRWVENVAASGTFVKNSAATWNVSGVNGIPNGWTVETAEENVAAAGGDDPRFGD